MPQRLAVIVLAAAVLAACQGDNRPAEAEWLTHWDRVVEAVPSLDQVAVDDPSVVCDEVLTLVREERQALIPTPDAALDGAVEGWLGIADETFFECPPRSGDIQGFDEAFTEMAVYRAEVEAAIGR